MPFIYETNINGKKEAFAEIKLLSLGYQWNGDEWCKDKPKPRTKTVYERVKFEKSWIAVKYFEDGGVLWTNFSHDGYKKIDSAPDVLRYLYKLYKPVEKEINGREDGVSELAKFINSMSPHAKSSDRHSAVALYDAGYRKVTE